jgi:hypothetical protein
VEIRDGWVLWRERLRPAGKTLWLALVGPVAAAAVASAVVLARPTEYRATATVVVPIRMSGGTPIAVAEQSVADFIGAVRSETVIHQVARSLDVADDVIGRGTSARRVGNSSIVEVSFEGRDLALVRSAASEAALRALELLQRAVVAPLERQLDAAQTQYEKSEADLASFLADTGFIQPDQVFRVHTSRLIALRDELGQARDRGDVEEAARLEAEIERKQVTLTEQVVEWRRLQDARQRALNALFDADSRYLQATGQLAAVTSGDAIQVTGAESLSKLRRLPATVVASAVVGEALSLALIALLLLLRDSWGRALEPEEAGVREPAEAEEPSAAS